LSCGTNPKTSGRFWKLLGASTDKNRARTAEEVTAAADFEAKAAALDDEQLRKAAKLLDLDALAESADIPQFLAIAREAAERTTSLRPFDVQLQGRCGCSPATSWRWPPVRARRCPAPSPRPATRWRPARPRHLRQRLPGPP
jgi:hypothetical protein